MAKSTIYAGLEIGTSKICVVIGEAKRDGTIKILGVGTAPSRGVRKGEIVDFQKVQTVLNDALVRAEEPSDVMIRTVFLGVTGGHIKCVNSRGAWRLAEDQGEITEDDVEEAKEAAMTVFKEEVKDKPTEMQEKILEGKMASYFKDQVLLEQSYIRDESKTIRDLLNEASQKFGERVEITKFARFSAR